MNINKHLRDNGFIFPENTEYDNIRMLRNMGAIPVMKCKKLYPSKQKAVTCFVCALQSSSFCAWQTFGFRSCTVADIKFILHAIEDQPYETIDNQFKLFVFIQNLIMPDNEH